MQNSGVAMIDGMKIGVDTKRIVSYLPERTYLAPDMRVQEAVSLFADFYEDFQQQTAEQMLADLHISLRARIKTLSKGTREKVQLILVMSRRAKLYLLDEPIGGVDPAARDYILKTILTQYNPEASILITTHLISDVEKILDDIVMLKEGEIVIHQPADVLREEEGKSIDALFREVFAC